MKLQVFLLSCFLFAGNLANPSRQEAENGDSNDLRQLLSEFTDATAKWSSLYEKFEKAKSSDCREPENSPVCEAIEEEARTVTEKLGNREEQQMDGDVRILNSILSSIHEKVEKLERKIETGVGGAISTRDYIQAMKGLERRLNHFQTVIMSLGREAKTPMRYVDGTDDDAVEEVERFRQERGSGRGYGKDDVKGIKHEGKAIGVPYGKFLISIERLEEIVEDVKSCVAKNQVGQYKNSIFKDMKDMLEDISEDIKSLRKMSSREMNENEKILRKINKKLERELKDDDKDDEDLKRSLKKYIIEQRKELEKEIKKALSKKSDDTDDSDEKGKSGDTDEEGEEEDESCDDSDGCDRKKKVSDTDSDETDDDDDDGTEDDTDDGKGRKKGKDETDDSEDADDTDDDRKSRKKKNRKNLIRKHSAAAEENVEFLRNSASGGPFGKNKFVTSPFGIPPYVDH